MKYMNMKKRFWSVNLQLFAEGGEGGDDDSGGEDDDQDDDSDDEDSEDDQNEKKFTQKDVDDAVKKRLARERRKWQREHQKNESVKETDKTREHEGEEDKKLRDAEEKASNLEMKWTCLEHDVKKECVDDVLALAKVRVSKDSSLDIEDAIDEILEKYPQFKEGEDDEEDDNSENEQKKGWGKRHQKSAKQSTTVEDEIRKQLFGK